MQIKIKTRALSVSTKSSLFYRLSMNSYHIVFYNAWMQAEEVIDNVVKEAISKPWLPLPIGLKPPSTDSVLAELSRQGISSIPPSYNGSIPYWHLQPKTGSDGDKLLYKKGPLDHDPVVIFLVSQIYQVPSSKLTGNRRMGTILLSHIRFPPPTSHHQKPLHTIPWCNNQVEVMQHWHLTCPTPTYVSNVNVFVSASCMMFVFVCVSVS